jgi:hypothetical protein
LRQGVRLYVEPLQGELRSASAQLFR